MPDLPKISARSESRDQMVLAAAVTNKFASKCFEEAGVSITTGERIIAAVDRNSAAIFLGSNGASGSAQPVPLPPQNNELEEYYEPTVPSQPQSPVSACLLLYIGTIQV